VKTIGNKVVRYYWPNYLYENDWWDIPLNVNFALSKPLLGTAAVLSWNDEYSICITVIAMEYQITEL